MDPQRIIKLQKIYQNSNQKLWLRGPRSKALVYPYYALFTVSTAVPLYYLGRALFGIKAEFPSVIKVGRNVMEISWGPFIATEEVELT
ncbi:Cytochrome c oxidase subunit 7 [Candidozyma auris]